MIFQKLTNRKTSNTPITSISSSSRMTVTSTTIKNDTNDINNKFKEVDNEKESSYAQILKKRVVLLSLSSDIAFKEA